MITIKLFSLYPQAEGVDNEEDIDTNDYGIDGKYRPFDFHFLRIISVYSLKEDKTIEYSRQLNRPRQLNSLRQLNSSNITKTEGYEATHI